MLEFICKLKTKINFNINKYEFERITRRKKKK